MQIAPTRPTFLQYPSLLPSLLMEPKSVYICPLRKGLGVCVLGSPHLWHAYLTGSRLAQSGCLNISRQTISQKHDASVSDLYLNPFRLVKLLPKSCNKVCNVCSEAVCSHTVRLLGTREIKDVKGKELVPVPVAGPAFRCGVKFVIFYVFGSFL